MNLLILDSGHSFDTKGKCNIKENFYEWEFNNDMQYKIKNRCEDLGIKVFLTNPNPATVSDISLTNRASLYHYMLTPFLMKVLEEQKLMLPKMLPLHQRILLKY